MIIDKIIKIKTNPSNYKHYIDSGYSINKCGDYIDIDICHLPEKSHVIIRCKCSKCEKIKEIVYSNYKKQVKDSYYVCVDCWKYKLKESIYRKYGVYNIRHKDGITNKIKKTNIEKYDVEFSLCKKDIRDRVYEIYGVSNISKLDEIKEIKRQKSIKKFGTNTPLQNEKIKEIIRRKQIDSGRWFEYDKKIYKDYRKYVDLLTEKNKKELFEVWDGYDFYDKEYIRDNLNINNNHNNYPSIDHKIPVIFGFINDIDPSEISNIKNLCITKRYLNTLKFTKGEEEFKLLINLK